MTARWLVLLTTLCLVLTPLTGCGGGDDEQDAADGRVTTDMARKGWVTRTNPKTKATWQILIVTDRGENEAKPKAEDILEKNQDIDAFVGLYAYNPPAALQAVEAAGLQDKIKILAFDEDPQTLRAIREGKMIGTVVQDPYVFGFRSIEMLAAKTRGQKVDVPKGGLKYIPTRFITPKNIAAFENTHNKILAGNGPVPEYDADQYDTSERKKIIFVTNVWNKFWLPAEQGTILAGEKFNVDVTFKMPPNGEIGEQRQIVEDAEEQGEGIDGLAISVRNPKEQISIINEWTKKMKVITVDSDASDSDRLFYIGTNNVAAGRQAGEELAKAMPKGGKVVILVGELTQSNAKERAQGVINALLGQ